MTQTVNSPPPPFDVLNLPYMPPGEIARQLKAPFAKFFIAILPKIRWENFRAKTDGNRHHVVNMPPGVTVFKILRAASKPTKQTGTTTIEGNGFTFMLYASGAIVFYPRDLEQNILRGLLYWLTTPKPAGLELTREQALCVLGALELYNLEGESPVAGDPCQILPKEDTRISVTEFDPVPYFGPATVENFVDASKEKKEIGSRGSPRETTDVQEMIAKPMRVEGWLRRIPAATVALGEKVNQLVQTYNHDTQCLQQVVEVQNDDLRHLRRSIRTMNKDLAEVMRRIPEDLEDRLDDRADMTEILRTQTQLLRALLREAKQGNALSAVSWAQHEELKDKLDEGEASNEMRHSEVLGKVEQEATRVTGAVIGAVEGIRKLDQKVQAQAESAEQSMLKLQIRTAGVMDSIKELDATVKAYHQGVIQQAQWFLRKFEHLEQKEDAIRAEFAQLRSEVVRQHAEQHLRRMQDKTADAYTWIFWLSRHLPGMAARDIAQLLGVEDTLAHYYLNQMRAWGYLDREKREREEMPVSIHSAAPATVHPADPSGPGSGSGTPPPVPRKRRAWKVWLYFTRKRERGNKSQPENINSNQKTKGEKYERKRKPS